jgi:hypothetical protein
MLTAIPFAELEATLFGVKVFIIPYWCPLLPEELINKPLVWLEPANVCEIYAAVASVSFCTLNFPVS